MSAGKRFEQLIIYLKAVCILMITIGLFWMVAGKFDPFGIYDVYFGQFFWNSDVPPQDSQTTISFLMILLGAMLIGYFILYFCLIHYGFKTKQLWVWKTAVLSIAAWFLIDTTFCLVHGAYFNIVLANIPTLLLLFPLFLMKKHFTSSS